MRRGRLWVLPLLGYLACSEYDFHDASPTASGDSHGSGEVDTGDEYTVPASCSTEQFPPEPVPVADACDSFAIGGFNPAVEWEIEGQDSTALPAVADLDNDGMPEVVVNLGDHSPGDLVVYRGDGTGEVWRDDSADLDFSSGPVVADIDGDGWPEILGVRSAPDGTLSIAAWTAEGARLWESSGYYNDEFIRGTGISVADMDHDGTPEIVAGRAILNADGSPRGEGLYGFGLALRGNSDEEGAFSAIADLDLDGEDEVVVGNALYGPEGEDLWHSDEWTDGAVAVANLDDDPEGEWIATLSREIRAHDTDGSILWGPLAGPADCNGFSVPAVGDVDGDGRPEVIVACGSELWALNGEDGSLFWSAPIKDDSGATGASLFDFDGDGVLEVLYADETQITAFDGLDGSPVFWTGDHASDTFFDYPVIADIDGDGHAEFVVMHRGFRTGLTVYGSDGGSWAPARKVWNQHAYSITNISDDLGVPIWATPNFTTFNSWHSAQATLPAGRVGGDIQAEILAICDDDCAEGVLWVTARARNAGSVELPVGFSAALYAVTGDDVLLLGTQATATATPPGTTTEALVFRVPVAEVEDADELVLRVDDDGNGIGQFTECVEDNNEEAAYGPWCP